MSLLDSKSCHPKHKCIPHICQAKKKKIEVQEKRARRQKCAWTAKGRGTFIRSKRGSTCQRNASTGKRTKTQGISNRSHREESQGLLRKRWGNQDQSVADYSCNQSVLLLNFCFKVLIVFPYLNSRVVHVDTHLSAYIHRLVVASSCLPLKVTDLILHKIICNVL